MLSSFQFLIHILLSILFVYKLNMGVSGAMIALSMSLWFLMIGEFIYIFGGRCLDSWRGFIVAAFKDLVPVIKLSISSSKSFVTLELWTYGTMLFWSYLLDTCQTLRSQYRHSPIGINTCSCFSLYVLDINSDINSWELMISLGFYGAICVQVANELGRGKAKAVKFYHLQVGQRMFQQMTEEVFSNKYCYEEP
ncbi:hypothetical protein Hdeb2414_s0013g00412291 [Helianthus debilis subsp. tardiflorus]